MATTAVSGTDARQNPVFVMIAGWLLPGAGHWLLGRRRKALFFLSILLVTFGVGYVLGEFRNVSAERHPYYFGVQAFLGIPSFVAAIVSSKMVVLDRAIPAYDLGILYTCVAALLNALLFLDAYEIAERKRLGIEAGSGDEPGDPT